MNVLEEVILIASKDENLKSISQLSDMAIDKYENEIIENVYEYSRNNKYKKAILLIGAAHKKSIMLKLQDINEIDDFKLNWSFYN